MADHGAVTDASPEAYHDDEDNGRPICPRVVVVGEAQREPLGVSDKTTDDAEARGEEEQRH